MAPATVPELLLALRERAGARFGALCLRHPRLAHRALSALERAGLKQAGWALLALDLAIDGGAQ